MQIGIIRCRMETNSPRKILRELNNMNESSCHKSGGKVVTPNKATENSLKSDENQAFTQRQPSIDDTIDGTIDETGIDLLDESFGNQALVKGFQAHHLSSLHDATLESLINGLNNLRSPNCTVKSDLNANTDDEEFVECQSYGDIDNTRLSSKSNSLENIAENIPIDNVEKCVEEQNNLNGTLDIDNSFEIDLNLFKENNPDLSFEQVHVEGSDEEIKEINGKQCYAVSDRTSYDLSGDIDPLEEASSSAVEKPLVVNSEAVANNNNIDGDEDKMVLNVVSDMNAEDSFISKNDKLTQGEAESIGQLFDQSKSQTIDFEENFDDLIAPSYIQKTSSLKQLESPAPSFNETVDINISHHINTTADRNSIQTPTKSFIINQTQNLNVTVNVEDNKLDMTFDKTQDLSHKTPAVDETVNIDNKTFETNLNTPLECSNTYETDATGTHSLGNENPFDKGNKTFDQAENLFTSESVQQQNNIFTMPEITDLNDRRLSIRADIFKQASDQNQKECNFKRPSALPVKKERNDDHPNDDFHPSNEFNFSPSDLDYLLTKGNSNLEDDVIRDSVLLRFDPLLSKPVQIQKALNIVEEESSFNTSSSTNNGLLNASKNIKEEPNSLNSSFELEQPKQGENDKMSLGSMIIENDLKEQFGSGENKMTEQNQEQDYKMSELQKKMKNDSVKIDDIEKKLKEAEMREDALLKRITEKDKTINKMSGVVEAYEKAIAELIAEKETIVQQCEKKYTTLLANSEVNEKHLDSLEKTFSDLHAKYERTKQMSQDLKENEERLLSEQRKNSDLLKKQEQRYEKMKNHALVQLEIANNKLSDLSKAHQEEVRRLKAQLKKEEISKLSTHEQLLQKTKENEELVKICDELLSGNAGNS